MLGDKIPLTKIYTESKIEKKHKTLFFEIFLYKIEFFCNFKVKYCRPLIVTSR